MEPPRGPQWFSNAPGQCSYQGAPWPQGQAEWATGNPWSQLPFYQGSSPSIIGPVGWARNVQLLEGAVQNVLQNMNPDQSRTTFSVLRAALFTLGLPSLSALGLAPNDIPSLNKLACKEAKVTALMECYIAARCIVTLHDLEREVLDMEGVKEYQDLALGPLLEHPVVIKNFPTVCVVCRVTTADVLHCLSIYMNQNGTSQVDQTEFLRYLGDAKAHAPQQLGVLIKDLRMYVEAVNRAQQAEKDVVAKFSKQARVKACHARKSTSKVISRVSDFLKREAVSCDVGIKCDSVRGCPVSPVKHDSKPGKKKVISAEVDDCNKRKRLTSQKVPSSQSSCPYPSAAEERDRLIKRRRMFCTGKSIADDGLRLSDSELAIFARKFNEACKKGNVHDVLHALRLEMDKPASVKSFAKYPQIGLLNVAILVQKAGLLEDIIPGLTLPKMQKLKVKRARHEDSVFQNGEPSSEVLLKTVLRDMQGFFSGKALKTVTKGFYSERNLPPPSWWIALLCIVHCLQGLKERLPDECAAKFSDEWFFKFLYDKWDLLPEKLTGALVANTQVRSELEVNVPHQRLCTFLRQALFAADDEKQFAMELRDRIRLQFHGTSEDSDVPRLMAGLEMGTANSLMVYAGAIFPRLQGVELPLEVEELEPGCQKMVDASVVVALKLLDGAPPLSDLAIWSQWNIIYRPSLGELLDFLETGPGQGKFHVFVALNGALLRINKVATLETFLASFTNGCATEIAESFISLFSIYGGVRHIPKVLWQSYATKGVHLLMEDKRCCTAVQPMGVKADEWVTRSAGNCVLEALLKIPDELRVLAAEILLPGLKGELGNEFPAVLLQSCKTNEDRSALHGVGLRLGVVDWVNDFMRNHKGAPSSLAGKSEAVQESPRCIFGMGEFAPQSLHTVVQSQSCPTEVTTSGAFRLGEASDRKSTVSSPAVIEQCRAMIESIRREEFGLGQQLDASESNLLLKQHARMGRALKRLSQDLYSEDSHFVLELVQNADDNMYEFGVQPTMIFVLEQECITVFNNEVGFTEANIRALCDVGNSTKADRPGYIGQKGIGFKSVFRVTDAPEIHSNGFHFKFDVLDGDIGSIVPTCIEARPIFSSAAIVELLPDAAGGTLVHLPIKHTLQINKLFGDLDDVHPSLLLFLRKLRCIAVENRITGSTSILRRQDPDQNLVKVSNSNGSTMSWVVAREQLHPPVARPGKEATELVLGFPVLETPSGEYRSVFGNQKVFAYLPLRSYGLKFLVQADFLLTASREDVDKDNAWNQWLLSWIPSLFIKASSSFRRLSAEKSPGLCITEYLRFVPAEGEVHGFFQALPRLILSRLRASACLPVDGELEYAIPSLLLRGWDDDVRAVVPGEMLRKHLGLQYLHRDVSMSDSLTTSLGVQVYGKVTITSLIASVSQEGGLDLLGPKWIRSCMLLLHNYIRQGPQVGLTQEWKELSGVPFLPLSDGIYTSFGKGRLWFTSRDEDEDMLRHLPLVLADLKIIHPTLLGGENDRNEYDTSGDKVRQLLLTFGIHEISTHEVVKTHVLTTFMGRECLGKNPKLMVEYLSLAMFHLQSDCRQCKAENFDIRAQLKKCAVILTNNGLKRIGSEPMHFSQMMGNPVDLKGFLRGTEVVWNEVDSCYCNLTQKGWKSSSLIQWRTFFKDLGISDFLQVERKDADGSSESPDWHCPELIAILRKLCPPNGEMKINMMTHAQKQLAALMTALDEHWHSSFSVCGQQFDPTFIAQLQSLSCLTCSMTGNLQRPTLLYDRCKAVEEVLGAQAPYALPKITSTGLSEALGLRTRVFLDDAINVLEHWHRESPFAAGLSQMERFYSILWQAKGTEKEKVIVAMNSQPSIFLPLSMDSNVHQSIPGNFHHPKDLVWDDPTGAVEALYKASSSGSSQNTDLKISLKSVYPRLGGFFVDEVQVPQALQFDGYLDVLMHISRRYSPYEMQKHVVEIFKALSQQVENGGVEPSVLDHWRSCFQKKKHTVFPTYQGNWVSLSSCEGLICLSDCTTVRQEMTGRLENVHFLLLGDDAPGKDLDRDDRIVKTDVLPLLRALDVPLLSETVVLHIVTEHERDGSQLQNILLWSLQYIQRYMAKHRPQEYRGLQISSIHERIKCMQCVVVEELSYRYTLSTGNWSSQRKTTSCLFQAQDCKLYVQAAYADDFCTIYKEMSRFFLLGQADLQLANFCQIVTSMQQSGASDVDIETFVSKVQGIPPLEHGDPAWSMSVESSMVKPKSGPAPAWDSSAELKTEEADECTDGRSARHHDKRLKRQVPNEQQDVTGRAGEALVFRHLVQKHGADKVTWVNEAAESGAAFDILVELEDGSKEFVEVKSTRATDKDWFEISAREWEFAHQHGPSYIIMRVHLGQKPRLLHLRNPVKLCHNKALQIALIMQDSTGCPGN